ncbi:hypothetical protein ACET3Z_005287 [Daucus carota]
MKCGRVDVKSAPYDTIQLKRAPSWLGKDCSDFGPPVFTSSHVSKVPLSRILPWSSKLICKAGQEIGNQEGDAANNEKLEKQLNTGTRAKVDRSRTRC